MGCLTLPDQAYQSSCNTHVTKNAVLLRFRARILYYSISPVQKKNTIAHNRFFYTLFLKGDAGIRKSSFSAAMLIMTNTDTVAIRQ